MNASTTDSTRHLATGLNSEEAARRLVSDGANEIESERPRTALRIAREILVEPMFVLLLAAAGIYLLLGDLREALVLAASIAVISIITLFQERRTEHALARLRDLSNPRALVIRDSVEQRIPGREVVAGDVILLREGDRVPADAIVHSATALSVDESILTGESLPVDKQATSIDCTDARTRVYSGTLIVRGYGVAIVVATGSHSEIGKIGRALRTLTPEATPLFREVRRIVRWVAVAALLFCAFLSLTYALLRHDWLGGILAGITLAMGVLPEEFPVVLTLFLAMGAWRISRVGVLARRMPAVESIGAVTVLCVDKTGTLTENRMRVALLQSLQKTADLRDGRTVDDADLLQVLSIAAAASEPDAFDPMERAIHESCRALAPQAASRLKQMKLIREYDLTPELPAVTHVWQQDAAQPSIVAVKGAPESVLALCRIEGSRRTQLLEQVAAHAGSGLRILGVASGQQAGSMPSDPHGFELQLLGFVGLADPLRSDVPGALSTCHRAGIRVVMITGDHPGTARAIAQQAGFDISGGTLTGADIAALDESQVHERVRSVNVFARMTPVQKLRLVQALKANGEVVAMTGDGVNDAPALKAADIGVAMGARGTDVAREAASIVLVNDDFGSLVAAVRLGRRIYDNIRHAMTFIVAVHIPIAGMGLLPVLFGWPLLFFPLHVLFMEFVIDPACAFVFEADPEAPNTMHRPPRRPDAPIFNRTTLLRGVALGGVVLLVCLSVYAVALVHLPETEARALAFIALVSGNLALIFVSRSHSQTFASVIARPNRVFWWIVALAAMALVVVISMPSFASLFRFTAPSVVLTLATALTTILCVLTAGLVQRPTTRTDCQNQTQNHR